VNVDFRSSDPAELLAMLQTIYAGEGTCLRCTGVAALKVAGVGHEDICVYQVFHATPTEFTTRGPRDAHVVVIGTRGEGAFHGEHDVFRCASNSGGVLSIDGEFRIAAGSMLGYYLIRIGKRALTEHCAEWLGTGFKQPVLFKRSALSDELSIHMREAASAIYHAMRMQWSPATAIRALAAYALSLIVTMHPHEHSATLRKRMRFGKERVREANWLVERTQRPLTIGTLASQMGCSVAQLIIGFRQHSPEMPLETLLRTTRQNMPRGADGRQMGQRAWVTHCESAGDKFRQATDGAPRLTAGQVVRLDEHIERNMGEKLAMEDLLHCVGLQRASFTIRFRNRFGVTPAQYLIRCRIERAKRLLAETHRSITDIAAEIGCSSHSHLSSQFLRRMGLSPRASVVSRPLSKRAPSPRSPNRQPGGEEGIQDARLKGGYW